MLQTITFTGDSDDLQKAVNTAAIAANAFLRAFEVAEKDVISATMHFQTIVIDGIVWHYSTHTFVIETREELHLPQARSNQ
jgi:hypothetical protein